MTADTTSTAERILDAALELFADQGFDRTSVGDIEEAAGLSRRSGGFYRHFDSKRDVLEAVIDRHAEKNEQLDQLFEKLSPNDSESAFRLFLQSGMELIERGHKVYLSLLPLADEYPDLFERMHDEIVARSYDTVERWARTRKEQGVEFSSDPKILGLICVHAMVQYKQESTLFDQLPAGVSEEDYLETLVDLVLGQITED